MVVSNTTPFSVETNRWYVGIFNSAETNVPFSVEACASGSYPTLIVLTNGDPYAASLTVNTNFLAPPGPPQWFFFEFQITNSVDAVLFELYNMNGPGDLVLQRDVPPTMAPYFAGSFEPGTEPEQIVVRATSTVPDLQGNWFLGIINNAPSNSLAYTIRATLPDANDLLLSALPLVMTNQVFETNWLIISWNAVVGDRYAVTNSTGFAINVIATTPVGAVKVPYPPSNYTVTPVSSPVPPRPVLTIARAGTNQVALLWPTNFTGFNLQSSPTLKPTAWNTYTGQPTTITTNWQVLQPILTGPTFYRLSQ
jgi:hypothetical protein